MGGIGSGFDGVRKRCVEAVRQVDVRKLKREGLFEEDGPGEIRWRWTTRLHGELVSTFSCDIELERERSDGGMGITCAFTWKGARRGMGADVIWKPCHLGGERPVFLCPCCSRECMVLFIPDASCRECADLNYRSQQDNHDPLERARVRLRKAWGKAGVALEGEARHCPDMHWRELACHLIDGKPRGMWWSTWEGLTGEVHAAQEECHEAFMRLFGGYAPPRVVVSSDDEAWAAQEMSKLRELFKSTDATFHVERPQP